jgi:DNA repair protein RadA/Sms
MAKSTPGYTCTECGWTAIKWVGQCGECQTWGTVLETGVKSGIQARVVTFRIEEENEARPITEISVTGVVSHVPTGIGEFDRVLGGGIVPGATILLSGEPGVGKSTLLLEVAARRAKAGAKVLYVSAEESVNQVRLRAARTGALTENLFLVSETDLSTVLGHIDATAPELLIVDSVQTVASSSVDGLAGGVGQVREVASALVRLSKERDLPLLLVGHVTKDGSIAGPRTLEHLVDVVCHFEGDTQTSLRFIRSLKNRFGPTDEVGCFEMSGDGIVEVTDPSGLFLSRSKTPVSGTCVTVALEGRRAMPVEIQALVVATTAPNPRRVTNGVDSSRVAMLLAVLERRAGLKLSDKDVYVSTVGGARLTEPGADLAIAVAVASAATDKPVSHELAAFGEISLAGEIRPVTAAKMRAAEASRLGFTNILDEAQTTIRGALHSAFASGKSDREREIDAAF